jgi:hypothetical protein
MRRAIIILSVLMLVGVSGALAANPGNPAVYDATATVTILKPITIDQTQALSYGRIVGPIGADASNTYAPNGFVGGTGGGSVVTPGTTGVFNISGDPGSAFSLSGSASGDCSDTKVVLDMNFNFPSITFGTGPVGLGIGTFIKVTNASDGTGPLGVVTCPYVVSAQYL